MRREQRPANGRLDKDDMPQAMTNGLLTLLEELAVHAVDYDYEECSSFQRELRETRDLLAAAGDSEAAAVETGTAISIIRRQNQEVGQFILNLATEKQAVIHLLTKAVLKLCVQNEASAQNLRALEKQLENATPLHEIRALKEKIAEALDELCDEALDHDEQLQKPQTAAAAPPKIVPVDTVTGLPGVTEAEAAFKEMARGGRQAYVVALTVRNLDVVNRRINFAAGNKLLMHFSQEIAQRLSAKDRLFRWRGPCFIALLPRDKGLASVRQEAAKFGSISQERTIEDNHSSIFFKMSTAWRLFPIPAAAELPELSNQIDAFLLGEPRPD